MEILWKRFAIAPLMEKILWTYWRVLRAVLCIMLKINLYFITFVNGDNFNRNDIMIGVLSLYYYSFPDLNGFGK